jgi:hypothetical protein
MSEALYFPFSRCLDELTLKRAALLYDRLLFVDPVTPEARDALYLREQHADPTITHRWRRAQQHYERLDHEGIAKTVTADVINDPEGIDALVADGLHVDIEINKTPGTLFNGRHRWKMLASRVPESMYYGRHQPKPAQAFAGEEIVEVSYAAGSSLSLTHAIAIAHELGATPLTDSKAHHDLLLYRMKTAAAAGADQQLPGMHAPPPGPPDAYLRRQIELRVIDALIPDEQLRGMHLGELIDYRRRHASARQDLSGWIDKLATEAHQKPWDSALETELGRIAAQARSIAGEPGRWWSAADAAVGSMGVGQFAVQGALAATPLLGGMVLGWPLLAALATGMALGIAPPALTSAINAMVKRRTPERNAVTYLINAGRR